MADLDIWTTYCEELMYERWDLSAQRAYRVVETLHRVYAFGTGKIPTWCPGSPFPLRTRLAWHGSNRFSPRRIENRTDEGGCEQLLNQRPSSLGPKGRNP